jgi:carboxymethylenebutenolidase
MQARTWALLLGLALGCAKQEITAGWRAPGQPGAAAAVERTVLNIEGTKLALHLPKDAKPPLPAVLLFHSAMGRTDAVLGYADALARRGYAACALDFYDGEVATSLDRATRLRDQANERNARLQALVDKTFAALHTDPRVRARRRVLLGWSYGGAWATHAAGSLDDVSAVIAVYGEAFSSDPTLYERIDAPMLLVGAAHDTAPSPKALREIEARLIERGIQASLVLFQARHGFMEPTHPGYSERPAGEAWDAILEFLHETRPPPHWQDHE